MEGAIETPLAAVHVVQLQWKLIHRSIYRYIPRYAQYLTKRDRYSMMYPIPTKTQNKICPYCTYINM